MVRKIWSIGTETLVNTGSTVGFQAGGAITAFPPDATGHATGWVVTWSDSVTQHLHQQRYLADGTAAPEGPIQVSTTPHGSNAVTATLPNGGWIVTWTGFFPGDSGVYQQVFAANGEKVGGETPVNTRTDGDHRSSSVTALPLQTDGGSGWVVTWMEKNAQDKTYDVFQQVYTADGQKIGVETRVNSTTLEEQRYPSVMALPLRADGSGGGWIVTWDGRGEGDGSGVYMQAYDAGGNRVGGETRINTKAAEGSQIEPSIAGLPLRADGSGGGWVVTWSGRGTQPEQDDPSRSGVFMQVYGVNGQKIGGETRVNTTTDEFQRSSKVTALPLRTDGSGGGWIVTWWGNGPGDDEGVFMQAYDSAGNMVGGEMRVNATTNGPQGAPNVMALSADEWVVTWGGSGGGDDHGVFQQRFSFNRAPADVVIASGGSIAEDAHVGSVVATLQALDPDPENDGSFTYELVEVNQLFEIEGHVIKVKVRLDDVNVGTHTLRVRVTDADGLSIERAITLRVTDVNENPIGLTLAGNTAAELSGTGTLVGTLNASDPDTGDNLRFTLLDDAGGRFTIVGNQLQVANGFKLDFEQAQTHVVSVRVSDKAGLSVDKTFTINLVDVAREVTAGSDGDDVFKGGEGADRFGGGRGSDRLDGGGGQDVMSGGKGADIFMFTTRAKKNNRDTITDFDKTDRLWFDDQVFKGLGTNRKGEDSPRKIAKKYFSFASESDERKKGFFYDKSKKTFFYDSDGSGGKAAIAVFKTSKALTEKILSASDLYLI